MTSVLDGLDDIPWAGLRDDMAYVRAERIPGLLRQLETAGPDEAWSVGLTLRAAFIHEHSGGYLEPAEFVVPFLIGLCGSPTGGVVATAADLLAEIACSWPFITEDEAGNDGMLERIQALLLPERPVFYGLLEHPDPRVRSSGAEPVPCIDAGADRCVAALERMWHTEEDERVRQVVATELNSLVTENEPAFGAAVPM